MNRATKMFTHEKQQEPALVGCKVWIELSMNCGVLSIVNHFLTPKYVYNPMHFASSVQLNI